jgi:agmatinase
MKVLNKQSNFLGLEKKYSTYENSEIVILPVPLEKTVSYGKGTARGPKEILKASHYVEFFDEETNREICFEKGIAVLSEDDYSGLTLKNSLDTIYKRVKAHLEDGKFVVTLGGEHSLSFPVIKAHLRKYPHLSILQIDAHSDLRQSYEGTKYSHACVMARVAELTKKITQVGIRAQCKEEAKFIKGNGIKTFYARDIRTNKFGENWHKKVVETLGENVYVTFDLDGFDPSLLPATGTPEPGGLFWDETMNLLKAIGKSRNIVGFDVVELAPSKAHPPSNFVASKLIYKLINYSFLNS